MKLVGRGLVVGEAEAYREWGDVEIDVDVDATEWHGRIVWYELTAHLLSSVTGHSVRPGTILRTEAEPYQIPEKPPYEVTLGEEPVVNSEFIVDDANEHMMLAAGQPELGEYQIYGKTVIANKAYAGRYIYVDYFYKDTDGETFVIMPPEQTGEFRLLAALKLPGNAGSLYDGETVLEALHCQRTTSLGLESDESEFGAFGFDFTIKNSGRGDVALHFAGKKQGN